MAESKTKKTETLAAAAVAPVAVAPASSAAAERPAGQPKPADKQGWWWGLGRRKTAVARVRLRAPKDGTAKVLIHTEQSKVKKAKTIEEYFAEERDRTDAMSPLKATNTAGRLEVFIRVNGGGYMGQAQAIKLAIARALKDFDPSTESTLRDNGMLTRDARDVERKKYGQAGARRRFQFSKR
ncbi:MAG: 30S ribosomal protein S9 [Phycisphaerales bacterium]|nr:30S ribosomal protein S9 [Phycisphaerales bacterium]